MTLITYTLDIELLLMFFSHCLDSRQCYGGNNGIFIDAGMLSEKTFTICRNHNFYHSFKVGDLILPALSHIILILC